MAWGIYHLAEKIQKDSGHISRGFRVLSVQSRTGLSHGMLHVSCPVLPCLARSWPPWQPCQGESGDIANLFFSPSSSISCPERLQTNRRKRPHRRYVLVIRLCNSSHNLSSPSPPPSSSPSLPFPLLSLSYLWVSKLLDTCTLRGLCDVVCSLKIYLVQI